MGTTLLMPHLFEEKYFRMISQIGHFNFAQIGLYYFALAMTHTNLDE